MSEDLIFYAGPIEAAVTNEHLGLEAPRDRENRASYGNFAAAVDPPEGSVSASDYVARLSARAAAVRACEIDDDLIAAAANLVVG